MRAAHALALLAVPCAPASPRQEAPAEAPLAAEVRTIPNAPQGAPKSAYVTVLARRGADVWIDGVNHGAARRFRFDGLLPGDLWVYRFECGLVWKVVSVGPGYDVTVDLRPRDVLAVGGGHFLAPTAPPGPFPAMPAWGGGGACGPRGG